MKKNILLISCLIFFGSFLFAQTGFDLGASGTFNSTWILKQNNYGTLDPFANPVVRQ
jgi:hypothetical protein